MDLFSAVGRLFSNLNNTPLTPIWQPGTQREDIGRPPIYPSNDVMYFIAAYRDNASVYTILKYLSQKFGSVPRSLYLIDDEQAQKSLKYSLSQKLPFKDIKRLSKKAYGDDAVGIDLTPAGRLAALTNRPNFNQGQDSYYNDVELMYDLTGEVFVELVRDVPTSVDPKTLTEDQYSKLPVIAKNVLPTQLIELRLAQGTMSMIMEYRFQEMPGVYRTILPVNMIHWKQTNPDYDGATGRHLRGLAPLAAGRKLLTQDMSATDAAVSMQQNQGAKGLLVNKNFANPTPEQIGQMRGAIDNNINNASKKGQIGLLGGSDYEYFNFGLSSVDLQLTESQQQVFIRLCNLFGIPPDLFLYGVTYENKQQAGKQLLTNKILPLACSFRDEENRVLLPAFGLDPTMYAIDIDATVLQEMADDMTALSIQLQNSPFLTFNEKRVATGNEEMDDPNMDKIYIPNNLISLDDINVNDGLSSYSGMGDPNQLGNGLPPETNTETGNAGHANNADGGQP